jgi:hypothetical protein
VAQRRSGCRPGGGGRTEAVEARAAAHGEEGDCRRLPPTSLAAPAAGLQDEEAPAVALEVEADDRPAGEDVLCTPGRSAPSYRHHQQQQRIVLVSARVSLNHLHQQHTMIILTLDACASQLFSSAAARHARLDTCRPSHLLEELGVAVREGPPVPAAAAPAAA